VSINNNVKILLYGSNIWYLGEGMLGPLFAVFAGKIGGDIFEITWAWAAYLIVAGVAHILVGKLIDGKNIEAKVMIFGYALNTIFTFGYLLVDSTVGLFIVQAGLGLAAALATPTWEALYSKYEDKKHGVYEWGIAGGLAQIITGIGILIGGFVVTKYGFDSLFIIMGFIQLVATIYQAKILRK